MYESTIRIHVDTRIENGTPFNSRNQKFIDSKHINLDMALVERMYVCGAFGGLDNEFDQLLLTKVIRSYYITCLKWTHLITLFKSITVVCRTDNIFWNTPHIQSNVGEYPMIFRGILSIP